ncbi:hypothetical protein SP38_215 [Salmonella phage 38]|uniref:Uncharacterized protein n=1 Tax=Salmonella phage 38 TaxID=1654891 RepID=A0A0N7C9Q9_9CAUD|nr:hypothetical protein SP38_215 [Salmonella phage 38]AKJ73817.1 hypothetical protein SP38_215 [Salmonella phage 38]
MEDFLYGNRVLEGDMIIRGRVKELTEFKGIKQTQITRAKLRKL